MLVENDDDALRPVADETGVFQDFVQAAPGVRVWVLRPEQVAEETNVDVYEFSF